MIDELIRQRESKVREDHVEFLPGCWSKLCEFFCFCDIDLWRKL